jgi:Terpene cyclase DEP1
MELPMFERPSSLRFALLVGLYGIHSAITAVTLTEFSLWGLLMQAFLNWGTGQIFSDLTLSLIFVCTWLANDARRRSVAAWPWILGTLIFGSLSPGLYLIVRERALLRNVAPAAMV